MLGWEMGLVDGQMWGMAVPSRLVLHASLLRTNNVWCPRPFKASPGQPHPPTHPPNFDRFPWCSPNLPTQPPLTLRLPPLTPAGLPCQSLRRWPSPTRPNRPAGRQGGREEL